MLGELKNDIETWAEGRSLIIRAPLLLWFAYIGVGHLMDPLYTSLFAGINLGIHEAGHLLFSWAPLFLSVAGGSLLQLTAPIASAIMFLRQPDYFAVSVCGVWLSTNLYGIATYAADARAMQLPLVTVGGGEGDIEHDWNYLLNVTGLLPLDSKLASLIRLVAFIVMWGSIAASAWMLLLMKRRKAEISNQGE